MDETIGEEKRIGVGPTGNPTVTLSKAPSLVPCLKWTVFLRVKLTLSWLPWADPRDQKREVNIKAFQILTMQGIKSTTLNGQTKTNIWYRELVFFRKALPRSYIESSLRDRSLPVYSPLTNACKIWPWDCTSSGAWALEEL